jgi:hypothetical protein
MTTRAAAPRGSTRAEAQVPPTTLDPRPAWGDFGLVKKDEK